MTWWKWVLVIEGGAAALYITIAELADRARRRNQRSHR